MTTVFAFDLALALSAAAAVAAACAALRLLSVSGALAAFVVGALVFGLGGSVAVAALLAFFLSSSLLSRLGTRRKAAAAEHYAKPGPRDAAQVLANGGVPVLLVVLAALTPAGAEPTGREWAVMLLGALAAVNADTWATEIGGALSRRPRLVTTLRVVPAGTSGAISAAGVAAALCGAAFIALAGWAAWPRASLHLLWRPDSAELLAIAWAGFVAAMADSVLGASLQARYRCGACGRVSEQARHCGAPGMRVGGLRWVTNDAVNLIASAIGALCAWFLVSRFAWPV